MRIAMAPRKDTREKISGPFEISTTDNREAGQISMKIPCGERHTDRRLRAAASCHVAVFREAMARFAIILAPATPYVPAELEAHSWRPVRRMGLSSIWRRGGGRDRGHFGPSPSGQNKELVFFFRLRLWA